MGRTGRAGRTGVSITLMAREDWKHAKELIEILKQGEQEVPEDLIAMADRYDAMLKKKAEEREMGFSSGRDGGRGGGFGGRGGGFGSNRRNNDDGLFSMNSGRSRGKRGGGSGFSDGGFVF